MQGAAGACQGTTSRITRMCYARITCSTLTPSLLASGALGLPRTYMQYLHLVTIKHSPMGLPNTSRPGILRALRQAGRRRFAAPGLRCWRSAQGYSPARRARQASGERPAGFAAADLGFRGTGMDAHLLVRHQLAKEQEVHVDGHPLHASSARAPNVPGAARPGRKLAHRLVGAGGVAVDVDLVRHNRGGAGLSVLHTPRMACHRRSAQAVHATANIVCFYQAVWEAQRQGAMAQRGIL